jgi:histidinol dehydrogenase
MEIYNYPSGPAEKRIKAILDRGLDTAADDYQKVCRIVEDVRTRGDAAVVEYTNQFDAPDMTAADLLVTKEEMDQAQKLVSADFLLALDQAADQIESFHRRQVRNSWFSAERPGVFLGQLVNPVDAAGIYVPGAKGGKTPLVSSVLMGAIPAAIAGVRRVVMTTPPMADNSINPHLLAAASRVGVTEVYRAGSAWAIAALAYGTPSIGAVDVIVGPGNIYVTLAKKIVSAFVGIDMIAGPSEILVIADEKANPAFIAADLLSQAEHDPMASAILVCTSEKIALAVEKELALQLETLPRKQIASQSLDDYGAMFVVHDLDLAVKLSNRIAPEHLELQVNEPFSMLSLIKNAGAIFMGAYTPEPVGDYTAGPNHVLPTGGSARFSSALSVDCFVKQSSVICYSREAFQGEAAAITALAETEGLSAHAQSIRQRLKP